MISNLFGRGGHATIGIFSNNFPQFRIVTKDESSFRSIEEEKGIHEENPLVEDLKVSSSYPCQYMKGID